MPSTFTERNRLELQAPGENDNTWGQRNNDNVIALIDHAIDGITSFTLSGTKTLTNEDGEPDEARARVLWITGGTGGTVTIPAVEKVYLVRNDASGSVTITLGSGDTVSVLASGSQWIFTDGTDVFGTATVESSIGAALRVAADAAAGRSTLGLGDVATLNKASTAQVRSHSGDAPIPSVKVADASAIVSLSDASTIAVDWTAGINFDVTLTANRALGNPTNVVAGTTRTIMVKGNSTTDRTLTFGDSYKGFLPTLSDIDNGNYYLLSLFAYTTSHIVVAVIDGGA